MSKRADRKSMQWLALTLVAIAAIATSSCQRPVSFAANQPFQLRVRQAGRLVKGDLDLYFRRVASDSRCPANVTCITAGEAIVAVEGRIMKGPVESFEVGLPGGSSQQDPASGTRYDGYRIQLLKLEPYPTAGVTPESTSYVGTFRVEKR